MRKKVRLYPYKMSSKSSRVLAKRLREEGVQTLRVYPDKNYRPKRDHLIINWGNSTCPSWDDQSILNKPSSVRIATNKLFSFMALPFGWQVPYLRTIQGAQRAIEQGETVYCRQRLTGKQGQGIVVAEDIGELVNSPLYTIEPPNIKREIRVHVFRGNVIDLQEKRKMNPRRREEEGITLNKKIRNYKNGYIFAREGVNITEDQHQRCVDIACKLNLDFCSLDMLEVESGRLYFLEANTASGVTGTTLESYVTAIKQEM